LQSTGARVVDLTAAVDMSSFTAVFMLPFAAVLAAAPLIILVYAYVGYPLILLIAVRARRRHGATTQEFVWPLVTITVPVYNAVSSIRGTLERLLDLDYPRDRLQLLVISDASTDGTDEIVRDFAVRGVALLRHPTRLGKTAGENAAVGISRGEIIVNVDATILVPRDSLKPLVRVFEDATIGDGVRSRRKCW